VWPRRYFVWLPPVDKESIVTRNASKALVIVSLAAGSFGFALSGASCVPASDIPADSTTKDPVLASAEQMIERGRIAFRHDTFGSEAFWGQTLRLHEAIAGSDNGGVGPGVSPATALQLGLKVDLDALPESVQTALAAGEVDLNAPATTLELLRLDSVVGVKGIFDDQGVIRSMGINCALCHSAVDNSFAPGIGRRLDGWANRDLNVGAIISAAPNLDPFTNLLSVDVDTVRQVLASWGPGKFDASLLIDGKAFHPDGGSAAVLIPPAFGLAGVNLATWTGWGSVTYWNAFVANLEMNGQGTMLDARLDDAQAFPIAAANGFGQRHASPDRVTPELAALHFYQLAIPAPAPPAGSFDAAAAVRGERIFNTTANCSACHVPPLYTEPGWNLHTPEEVGVDDFQANRSPTGRYRTAPLKGLWTHTTGGFYHDGRFATLRDVVDHYDGHLGLDLSENDKRDLVEFLKSL
jgi:mono/diheme cytochrome c family protein